MDKSKAAIDIEGMTCGSCVKTIESNVGVMPGVLSIQVELPDNEAFVVLDPTVVTMNSILDKINSMGFVATKKETPKDKTSEGCLDSSSQGAAGHQADLASIFSGSGAGDLERVKRRTARKPKAANGGVGGVSRDIEEASGKVIEQGQLTEKPEKEKKKRALSTKPAHLASPDLHPVVERNVTVVVFDVETSGSANFSEVIQLSATSANGNFSVYILPFGRIIEKVSAIHQITKVGGKLFYKEKQVPAKEKVEAWSDFISFCEKISPVLLVGHNTNFDARFTMKELAKVNLTESFMKVVVGFSDTLPLLKGVLPHLTSHSQAKIVLEVMGTDFTYESHNSEADVAALMEVLQKLKISEEKLIEYSFTVSSFAQHMKNLEEEKCMKILYSPRLVTRPSLKKLVMAGYTLEDLKGLAKSNNLEDFISTLLPVLPKEKMSISLYEMIQNLETA